MTVRTTSQYLTLISLSIIIAFFLKWSLVSIYRIPSKSMSPTFEPGDFVVVNKASYGFKFTPVSQPIGGQGPKIGDIVLLKLNENSGTYYIKRVIGRPGDKVEIKNGVISINRQELVLQKNAIKNNSGALFEDFSETYESKSWDTLRSHDFSKKNYGPITVPDDQYFLLGDNRDSSEDSRQWGTVNMSLIKGQVKLIVLSVDWQDSEGHGQMKWERFFQFPK